MPRWATWLGAVSASQRNSKGMDVVKYTTLELLRSSSVRNCRVWMSVSDGAPAIVSIDRQSVSLS